MIMLRIALSITTLMICAAGAASALKPRQHLADSQPSIQLSEQVPTYFGGWHEDQTADIALPDPDVQAQLRDTYADTLARTYTDAAHHHMMLSIAYGNDQTSEATQAHRPEYCYVAQGFLVQRLARTPIDIGGNALVVQRLIGIRGRRYEPISYWVTIAGHPTLPGLSRKLHQLHYGFRGQIPDGMVIRVSTIGLGSDQSFALQEQFLQALYASMNATVRSRYFGS